MTSLFSPPTDRRAAAGLVRALLSDTAAVSRDDEIASVRDLINRADTDPAYRFDLIAGLALGLLDELVWRYGSAGARERLEMTLLDVQLEVDDD